MPWPLRAWYEGSPSRVAIARYCQQVLTPDRSARGVLGGLRRQLADYARAVGVTIWQSFLPVPPAPARTTQAPSRARSRRRGPCFQRRHRFPSLSNGGCPHAPPAHGLKTLADFTVRIPQRKRWWLAIDGLGARSARAIEVDFAAHPQLTVPERWFGRSGGADCAVGAHCHALRCRRLSQGAFRPPRSICTLAADNDYDAIHAWLGLHESSATVRAYRKEAERLLLSRRHDQY